MEMVNEFIVQTNLKSGKKQLEKPKSKGLPKP